MAESELAGKVTRLLKSAQKLIQDADKLVQGVKKDIDNVVEQVNQLKGKQEKEETSGDSK